MRYTKPESAHSIVCALMIITIKTIMEYCTNSHNWLIIIRWEIVASMPYQQRSGSLLYSIRAQLCQRAEGNSVPILSFWIAMLCYCVSVGKRQSFMGSSPRHFYAYKGMKTCRQKHCRIEKSARWSKFCIHTSSTALEKSFWYILTLSQLAGI